MRSSPLITLFLFLAVPLLSPLHLAFAQNPVRSLEQALSLAHQHNNSLLAQRQQLLSAQSAVQIAGAAYKPKLNGSISYGVSNETVHFNPTNPTDPNDALPARSSSSTFHPLNARIGIEQTLFDWGAGKHSVRAAQANAAAANANLVNAEQSVLLDAARSFFNLIHDRSVLQATQSNVRVLQQHLNAVNDQLRVGELTLTDLAQSQARLAAAQSALARAQGNLDNTAATFLRITGQPPHPSLITPPPPPQIPASKQDAQSFARSSHPSVRAAKLLQLAADATLTSQKKLLLPSISANASYQYNVPRDAARDHTDLFALSANISIPLYQGGAAVHTLKQSKFTSQQRFHELADALQRVDENVTVSWRSLQTARAQIDAADKQTQASLAALKGVRQQARVGARSTLEVLDAEQEYLDAQTSLAAAQRDQRIASYALLAAMGKLSLQSLDIAPGIAK